MGELANILDFARPWHRPVPEVDLAPDVTEPARLIPGSHARCHARKRESLFGAARVESAQRGNPRVGFLRSQLAKTFRASRNVLVIGDFASERRIADAIATKASVGRSLKAFLSVDHFRGRHGAATLRKVARRECIDEIIVSARDLDLAETIILEARRNQLDVSFALPFGMVPLAAEKLKDTCLLHLHHQPLPEWQLAAKRLLDVVLASLSLLVLLPVLGIVALLVRLNSAGPAIYRSVRIGLRGRRFTCYKFRTMVLHTENTKQQLRFLNERHGAFFKITNDPRVTAVGRFLRKYSLDELPQLWNVLRGEMSLVGPRPHPPDDVEGYCTNDLRRLDCLPGMTGLWQVTARRDPSFKRCVELDVDYIKRWTPWLDLRILCQTVACVLEGSGV